MDTIGKLCELLEQKKERFLAYEKVTLAILSGTPEDVEHYIIQRGDIATEIDALDEEIYRLCDGEGAGEVMLSAARARIDFERVPAEYHCVFYAGQAVRSVASRLVQSDAQVVELLKKWQAEALESIKQNQNLPKIKKYLTDLTEKPPQGSLRNEKA